MKLFRSLSLCIIILLMSSNFSCESSEQISSKTKTEQITNSQKGIPVEASIVKSRNVAENIFLSGMLDPKHSVDIIAEVTGKIVKINKKLGDSVTKKDILAVVDDKIPLSNYKQAKSQVLSAENNLNIAQLNLISDEELYQSGDISKLEYENALLAVKTAEANHLSALATLSRMEKTYEDTRIKTPINGLISRKYIDLGTMINPNSPLYRVVDISQLKIEVGIPQEMVSRIEPGKKANVVISALSNQVYAGTVRFISPQADENTGSFSVEIYVNNTKNRDIRAGMTAKVELIMSSEKNQIVIPDHAVITQNDSNFVYIISDDKAKLTPIKIRETYDTQLSIEEGLSLGDTIVVVGMKNIKDGSPVWIELLN